MQTAWGLKKTLCIKNAVLQKNWRPFRLFVIFRSIGFSPRLSPALNIPPLLIIYLGFLRVINLPFVFCSLFVVYATIECCRFICLFSCQVQLTSPSVSISVLTLCACVCSRRRASVNALAQKKAAQRRDAELAQLLSQNDEVRDACLRLTAFKRRRKTDAGEWREGWRDSRHFRGDAADGGRLGGREWGGGSKKNVPW